MEPIAVSIDRPVTWSGFWQCLSWCHHRRGRPSARWGGQRFHCRGGFSFKTRLSCESLAASFLPCATSQFVSRTV